MMRWIFLCGCLLACGNRTEPEDSMPPNSIAPWHMWGNQLPVDLVATGAPFDIISPQLVNINYGRPETWSWIMWATVVSDNAIGAPGVVQVRFNLTVGIGRTKLTMDDFVTFIFSPTLPNLGTSWTTSTTDNTPLAAGATARIVEDLPAQDIILNANCIITGGAAPGSAVSLYIGAMFSPKSHIRPEWYEGRFPGGEDNGR